MASELSASPIRSIAIKKIKDFCKGGSALGHPPIKERMIRNIRQNQLETQVLKNKIRPRYYLDLPDI